MESIESCFCCSHRLQLSWKSEPSKNSKLPGQVTSAKSVRRACKCSQANQIYLFSSNHLQHSRSSFKNAMPFDRTIYALNSAVVTSSGPRNLRLCFHTVRRTRSVRTATNSASTMNASER